MKLRQMIISTIVTAALIAEAAVSVTDVKAAQRYPWNGLVDIDYTVVCDDANADVYVFPEGIDNDTGTSLQLRALTGEGANDAVKTGTHRMTWNAAKDMPNYHTTSFSVKFTAISGAAPYIVIDLSGGMDATNYPTRFSVAGPDLDDDTCRTTELWLRLIPPGSFIMGSPTTELGRDSGETQHPVTISKPFYLGVFEVTQKQWQLVMGTTPSHYRGDTRPVEYVSYDDIRGSLVGANWPSHDQVDTDSFLGKIRARTALNLDLPTEAQWEYACRAGTTTALNNGKDLQSTSQDPAMGEVGRYRYNVSDGKGGYSSNHTKAGCYLPNAWGVYDMHGNVYEWCLDWYENYTTGAQVDPVGSMSVSGRIHRGGGWWDTVYSCRSAFRNNVASSRRDTNLGFRLSCSVGR